VRLLILVVFIVVGWAALVLVGWAAIQVIRVLALLVLTGVLFHDFRP
jgi:hypothetical protein